MKRWMIVVLLLWSGTAEARLGTNLIPTIDFTSGWTPGGGVTINDSDTFTSTDFGGVYKASITPGLSYRITVTGTTTASSFTIRMADNTNGIVGTIIGTNSGTYNFTAVTNATNIYIRNSSAGETTITALTICPYYPPTRSVTPGAAKSPYLGTVDLLAGWDFTSGWTTVLCTINDDSTFTANSNGAGPLKDIGLVPGLRYRITVLGTASAGTVTLRNSTGNSNPISETFGTFDFTAITSYLYIRAATNGAVVDITSLTIRRLY